MAGVVAGVVAVFFFFEFWCLCVVFVVFVVQVGLCCVVLCSVSLQSSAAPGQSLYFQRVAAAELAKRPLPCYPHSTQYR